MSKDGNINFLPLLSAANYAVLQAVMGKGLERHAKGRDFLEQPIFKICELFNSNHGQIFQAIKKIEEAQFLPKERAMQEYRGAIIYLLAAMIYLDRNAEGESVIPDLGTENNPNAFAYHAFMDEKDLASFVGDKLKFLSREENRPEYVTNTLHYLAGKYQLPSILNSVLCEADPSIYCGDQSVCSHHPV